MAFTETYALLNVGKIIAGINSIEHITEIVAENAVTKALIITDQVIWNMGLIEKPKNIIESAGVQVEIIHSTPPEPEVDQVNAILTIAKQIECQLIIGIGGGSVMDVTKLIAVLLTNDVSLRKLTEEPNLRNRGIPTLLIPTTAGTGAEVTPNAIVLVPEKELKVGIVSDKMMANYVILDPLLTIGLPKAITASTGMDALAHGIECYISKKANPLSDTYALKAIRLISRSLRLAYNEGQNIQARHNMILGAMFGGISIATSSTTAVHALAYPLGGKYRIPHGLANAILLPHVMKFNLTAAENKFKDIAIEMGLDVDGLSDREAAEKMIENLYSLNQDLNIECNLRNLGIGENDLDMLVESASKVTRLLNNNPKTMTKNDIREIYQTLF